MILPVTRADIDAAAERIERHVRRTPLLHLGHALSPDYELTLKLEHLQVTGSFKPRGAFSLLTTLERGSEVAAASGGNFGLAVAHAASVLDIPATIFVPETSPTEKTGPIGELGADVRIIPGYYDEALAACRDHVASTGAFEAHAYDQSEVVAGQGTLGREIAAAGDFDCVLVAVGGGGLIGGIASWMRGETRVVAVEPETCQSLHASLLAGRRVEVQVGGVAASSLGARSVGEIPWAAREWIAQSVLVADPEIISARQWLWKVARLAVEPAAAATVAALRSGAFAPADGSRVLCVLSGGNAGPGDLA